jgi:peptide/nickel transport system ATP-binding protein
MSDDYVLRVKELDVQYFTDEGVVYANNNVSFNLSPGERLGLVGESGSGKSTMALALLRMIKAPGRIAGGEILLDDVSITSLSDDEMRLVRAREISMIPQGAMNSLNPVMRVLDQIVDGMRDHDLGLSKADLQERALQALESVELNRSVARMYPHELSGGMKQRVCIAISIAMHPK